MSISPDDGAPTGKLATVDKVCLHAQGVSYKSSTFSLNVGTFFSQPSFTLQASVYLIVLIFVGNLAIILFCFGKELG